MRNGLYLFIFTMFVIPQLVLAAWWNPLSWFNNWNFSKKEDKTEILEDRIKELENKLNDINIHNKDSMVITTTPVKNIDISQKVKTESYKKSDTIKKTFKTSTLSDDNVTIVIEKNITGEEIYSLISPSVVMVSVGDGGGTGFVIEDGKYTITNEHVVGNAKFVTLKFFDGTSIVAPVLGVDKNYDLALIYNNNIRPKAVKFGSSDKDLLKVGSDAYVLGYPLGSFDSGILTLTKGVISANKQVENSREYIQTDATTHSGNSGGPLINNKGEVVGIHDKRGDGTKIGGTGIALSIPVEVLKLLIPALSQYGQSRYEVYPIGSTQNISKSMQFRIDLNDKLSCSTLGFTDDSLTICELYKKYKKDYNWNIIQDY